MDFSVYISTKNNKLWSTFVRSKRLQLKYLETGSNFKQMRYSKYKSTILQAQENIIKVSYENQVKSDLHHMAMNF